MSENQKVRATRSPAEVYDEFFVPALFHQWGNVVASAAGVGPDQTACGTGVLARAAADRWTLGGMLDEAQFEQLLRESERALQPFVGTDGALAFAMPALLVTAVKSCAELRE